MWIIVIISEYFEMLVNGAVTRISQYIHKANEKEQTAISAQEALTRLRRSEFLRCINQTAGK